uniref:Aminotransferase-like plant mobile domain-containing protein n=1 Tax=Fagus sylvatica TaxID=28930 RepID=A0A2N9ER68_FAGSY
MASSSKTPAKTRGASSMGEEHPNPEAAPPLMAPEETESDSHSDSDPVPAGTGSSEEILARPILDPWYESGKMFPSVPAEAQPSPSGWEWLVKKEDAAADAVWVPPFQEILDLKIQRKDVLAVPLKFDFQCLRATNWEAWVDKELADETFCRLLEQAGVLQAILISRSLNMYRDTESLRQLVRRWCPSSHTFFFAHGELTVTLEDVENHWRLPILGDCDPSEVELSPAEIKAEAILLDYVGKKNTYLHADEMSGESCHFVATALNSSVLQAFLWEHAASCSTDGRRLSDSRQKFASLPEAIAARFEFLQTGVPSIYRWVGAKIYDSELVPSLDDEDFVLWRPYGDSHRGYFCDSVMSWFSKIEPQNYALGPEDIRTLSYLSVTSAGWLPVLTHNGLLFTSYCAHRVRRQFGYDQEVPATMATAADVLPTINPFIKSRAFAYWRSAIPEVVIPSGDRIGICTSGMKQYWRDLMTSMLEFRSSGYESLEHLLPLCKAPSTNPQLFAATNTVTTYSTKQGLGYVVWRNDLSKWMTYSKGHPSSWLEENPDHISAPEKVASKRGKRITATVSGPKREKPTAPEKSPSKGIVIREPASSQSRKQPVPKDVLGKKVVRKTRAKRKRSAVLPSPILHESPSGNTRSKKRATATTYSEARTKRRNEGAVRRPLTVSEDKDSSSSSEDDDDDVEGSVEGVPLTVDEAIASGVVAAEATATAEPTDSITATTKSVSGTAGVSDVPEEGVDAAEMAVEGAVEAPEGAVSAGIVDDVGLTQGGSSRSSGRVDSALLDSTPPSKFYVRRSRRANIVSSDSEKTPSVSAAHLTPRASQSKSAGASSMHVIPTPPPTVVNAPLGAPSVENIRGDEEDVIIPGHISDIGVGAATEEITAAGVIPAIEVPEVEHVGSEVEVIPSAEIEDDIPDIEGTFAQDPNDNAPLEDTDMADVHDSYDAVLAGCPREASGSGNEFAAEDEGEFDAVEAAESASAAIQSPFASLERLGVEISAVPAEILSFFQEFDRVAISRHRPQHFWIFDSAEVDFYDYSVPRDGIQFLEAIWKKYGNFISNFRLGNFVGGAMLTLLCCVLMQMRNTSLEDVTETNILEWKGVVQELIQEGFLLGFMIDHLREIARDMFGRRLTAELKTFGGSSCCYEECCDSHCACSLALDICHESCW